MIDSLSNPLRRHVRQLFPCRPFERAADTDLVRRFVADQDEEVFAELVRRHGPLVFGVARRVLGHREDAEDVFQATFLILARKAGSISRQASLGSWLHGVATRLAHKALVAAARRRHREQQAAVAERIEPANDLRPWIDAELARLPEALRLPIVLCLLEGRTQGEAAATLGWRPRTLKARLQRGKEVLRQRLHDRGTPASVVAIGAALAPSAEAVRVGLRETTVRLALLFARGAAADGPAVALAGVGLRFAAWSRVQLLLALLLAVGVVGLGAGLLFSGQSTDKPAADVKPAAGKDLHGDALPAGAVARLGTVRFRHPSWGVFRLAVTPDGKTIVTAGEEHDVCLWEMDTGRLIRRFHTGDLYPRGFALAPGGQLVALGGFRIIDNARPSVGSIQMRNTVTGKVVREIVIKDDRMDSLGLAFSPDGKLLASLNGNGVARLTEVATGIELLREQFPRDYAGPIRFSPDGTSLAVASGPNARKVFLWEWEKGKPPREIPVRPRGARSLDFSPDGKTLATGDDGNEGIRLWDVASGRMLRQFANTHDWDTIRVCWSPDGHYLASSGYHERALVLWDPRTGKEVRRLSGRRGVFGWIVFTPDSRRLVATSGDGVIHIFDVATGKELSAGRAGHHQAPSFVELRRDGTAVTAGDDGSVRFWDARTGTQRRAISVGPEWVRAAALSLDGRWLATSELGRKHAVRLWDARTGKQVYRLLGHGRLGGVRAVAFTADGKQFLSWGDDLYLRRWDIRNGKAVDERRAIPPGVTPTNEDDDERGTKFYMVSAGVFSRDGTLLAVQGIKTLAVLDARTGKEKIQMPWDGGHLMGLAISSDNKYLAASAWGAYKEVKLPDGRVRTVSEGHFVSLFEIATGKQLHRIVVVKDRERIGPPAFSADGKRFAVGVGDVPARILLFDTASGKPAGTIANVPAAVQSLAFSPDGKRLIAGLKDTTAVIWDLEKTLKER